MREPVYSGQFKRDLKRVEQRGFDMAKLRSFIHLLLDDVTLPQQCRDHALNGQWAAYRDLHITPDWILIYKKEGVSKIIFARTGTHADLFE